MVGSSKILTVSYGTFSCTLEGFDDSFSTMKAIAEYFRDLASDDRYFGAEPPTPDAEMLARIAEREVSRRVEAKMDDGSIVLKTGSALAAVGAAQAAETPQAVTQDAPQNFVAETADEAPQADSAPEAAAPAPFMPPMAEAPAPSAPLPFEPAALTPTDAYEDDDAPEEVAPLAAAPAADADAPHLDADSVAAKLQRIRAVVGRDQTEEAEVDTSDISESFYAAPEEVAEVEVEDIEADDSAILESIAEVTSDDMSEDIAEDVSEEVEGTQSYDEEPVVDDPSLDSINDALAAAAETSKQDEAAEIEAPVEDVEADLADETTDDAEPEAETDVPAPVRARVIRMRRNQVDAAVAAGALIGTNGNADETPVEEMQDSLVEAEDLDLPDLSALTDNDEADSEETGTIFDDLGASAEAEVEVEGLADLERMDAPSEETDADTSSSLSDDAEAELQAELAALVGDTDEGDDALGDEDTLSLGDDDLVDDPASIVENDTHAEFYADTAETAMEDLQEEAAAAADFEAELEEDAASEDGPDDTNAGPLRPRRVKMPGTVDENDGSMDRIMSQTEEQMSAPDSSRRRDAIDQLKAAVAATEADREMGDGSDADDGAEETFRDDLRQAVRPTRPIRPQRPTERSERSERPAPAPLKLVASQRVDVDGEEAAAEDAPRAPVVPVRPRRVMSSDEPLVAPEAGAEGGFAAFAQEMGATDLSDLLEAAAAYTSFVEGSEDFSRPQLMNKVKESSDKEYSREEGLRSFGTLLRQGRIMKVRNGRFQVSGETRFNPERQAG